MIARELHNYIVSIYFSEVSFREKIYEEIEYYIECNFTINNVEYNAINDLVISYIYSIKQCNFEEILLLSQVDVLDIEEAMIKYGVWKEYDEIRRILQK